MEGPGQSFYRPLRSRKIDAELSDQPWGLCMLPLAVASQFGCLARALRAGLSADSSGSWMVSAPGLGTGPELLWSRIWTSEGRRQ